MADNNCPDPDVYRRLSSMEAWSAEHRGACGERHRTHNDWQKKTDTDIQRLETDVTSLKVKLALIAGTAAAGGGTIGGLIAQMFQ